MNFIYYLQVFLIFSKFCDQYSTVYGSIPLTVFLIEFSQLLNYSGNSFVILCNCWFDFTAGSNIDKTHAIDNHYSNSLMKENICHLFLKNLS